MSKQLNGCQENDTQAESKTDTKTADTRCTTEFNETNSSNCVSVWGVSALFTVQSDLDGPPTAFPLVVPGPTGVPSDTQAGWTLWLLLLTAATAEAEVIVLPQTHPFGRMHVSWISADLGSTCSCVRHARELSSCCTTLTTSGNSLTPRQQGRFQGVHIQSGTSLLLSKSIK